MDDRCPGVLRLHAAADGHLARIRLPGGILTRAALTAIADLADLGNGLVELTSRASVQVRGLAPEHAVPAAERLMRADLLPSIEHDRVRNVLAGPLGGRGIGARLRTDSLVAALDQGLCQDGALAELPGRFLFAVEDGSGVLGGGQGDVTLVAEPGDAADVRLRLHLAGRPTTRTAVVAAAPDVALEAARAFLAVVAALPETEGCALWRIADLPDDGVDELLARLGTTFTAGARLGSGDRTPLGPAPQADGCHAVTALAPLGRLDSGSFRGLTRLAAADGGVRVSPWRTLTVVDVARPRLAAVVDELAGLGLVLDDASGWRGLSACAGLGACASARLDVRAAAARRAGVRGGAGSSAIEHWSACERGCGRPARAAHAITATSNGLEVESSGTTRRVPGVDDALAVLDGDGARQPTRDGGPPSPPADRVVALTGGGPRR